LNLRLLAVFFSGWLSGVIAEYLFHWIMHRWSLRFHLNHHKEFFHLTPRQVALNTLDPRLNLKFFALLLGVISPLMFYFGWLPVLMFWAGAFWHLTIVYEGCHAIMHHDAWLPPGIRQSTLYKWWKGCHFAHHEHSPTGNFCVTFPIIDWCMGTYVPPSLQAIKIK